MTAQEVAAMLDAQQRDAVLTGDPNAYYERMKPNAARPHNISFALWKLGVWTEAGQITPFGEQVRAILQNAQSGATPAGE
ncbi:hypothetical protein V3I01_08015 [Sphingomonas sp. gentR]|uniref:hypothetical protein n=1 Tax=unclassified Sphingomonas TaxID=196159 RepID=UPI0009727768|nr:hypothetical protein [Sphingomonas sp. LK11]APX66274.1 hypothetical protein AV944_11040 [Sphingomonas sp. LK11]